MGSLLHGKETAEEIRRQSKADIANRPGFRPALAFVQVGENESGRVYTVQIEKAIKESELAIDVRYIEMPSSTTETELVAKINELNDDAGVNAIIILQPLNSEHRINLRTAIETIDTRKDVEGLRYENSEKLNAGLDDCIVPPSAAAYLALIRKTEVGQQLDGKHVVLVTSSQWSSTRLIQSDPIEQLMRLQRCVVTIVDPDIDNAPETCKLGDIVVAISGGSKRINSQWIKPNAVVIDAGFYIASDGARSGNVDTADVLSNVSGSVLTPVPGGVGPVVVAQLLHNTVQCAVNTQP